MPEGLDRLVLDRFVALERGLPVLSPELPMWSSRHWRATKDRWCCSMPPWRRPGATKEMRRRFGCGSAFIGRLPETTPRPSLAGSALRGLPAAAGGEVRILAHRILQASEAVGLKCNRKWVRSLVLADAHWRVGDAEAADALDAAIASVPLAPDHALQAACGRILRRGPGRTASLRDLETLRALLDAVSTHDRAAFHTTVATVLTWRLDVEGALAALHDALANRPVQRRLPGAVARPAPVRDRPGRRLARALRTIELARDHGLLRYEVLAWGLAAG